MTDTSTLLDNQWGNPDAQQSIWLNEDGSYGWDFDSTGTSSGINYPEVLIGTKPWGTDTGTSHFPIRRGDVDEFVLDIEAEYDLTGGEWDWAQEWWLLEEPVAVETETHQYEVMLVLDWGGGHDHGTPVYTDLWTDKFGNTVDLWALYDSGGTQAPFYIFRVQGGHDGGKVDMKPIVDWLTDHEGIREDLLISGSELGNEYWPEAVGTNTISKFNLTINGETYVSGGPESDVTAPTAPSNLSSPTHDSSTVELDWEDAEDSGGSGLAAYEIYRDGSLNHRVSAKNTATTVTGLASGTEYRFAVTAVDEAGNESSSSNEIAVTTDSSIQSGSVYRLENEHSGLLLDVRGAASEDSATLEQQTATDTDSQRWALIENSDGTYRLENQNSGKVADVEGWSTEDGGDIHQWSWTGGANQRWNIRHNGDGTYRLENEHSGLVMDVRGWSTADGTTVHQWSWTGGANQRWVLSQTD